MKHSFISEQICELLNNQVAKELTNSHSYLTIATYFDKLELRGFSSYFKKQSLDERDHAMKLIEFMADSGITYMPQVINQIITEINSPLAASEQALNLEIQTTKQLENICSAAISSSDFYTLSFIQNSLLIEQQEELSKASELYTLLDTIQFDKSALIVLNEKYATM